MCDAQKALTLAPTTLLAHHPPCNLPAADQPRFSAAVRLVNGTGGALSSGRVEVLRHGVWIAVRRSGDVRDGLAAAVVCRQLGYAGSSAPIAEAAGTFGPPSSGPSLVLDNCVGSEASLEQCGCASYGFWPIYECAVAASYPAGSTDIPISALAVTCGTGTGGPGRQRAAQLSLSGAIWGPVATCVQQPSAFCEHACSVVTAGP